MSVLSAQDLAGQPHRFLVAALLCLLGALTRLPFVTTVPINWDAVQFALALDRFDLHAHQPHAPGYILYVLLGQAANLLAGNPSLALSSLSVLASALSVPLVYLLALDLLDDPPVALGASLLVLASPLALYYGAVGLTYMPEMLLSIAVAWAAWRVRNADIGIRNAVLLGVLLALAGGVRQTTLLVLLPLCFWAVWQVSSRVRVAFGLSAGVATMLWLLPLLAMSGGPEAYMRENALLSETTTGRTSLFAVGPGGLLYNLAFEGLALVVGLGFAVLPLGIWAARVTRFSLVRNLRSFLAWWVVPALAFYALTHVGQYGYVLVALPPVAILSALSVRVLLRQLSRPSRLVVPLCSLLAVASAGYFALAQGPTTASDISSTTSYWSEVRAALAQFDPARTVLISTVDWDGPFRHAGYLLPDYHVYAYGDARATGSGTGWLYSAYGGRSTYDLPRPSPQAHLDLPPGTGVVVALDNATGAMLSAERGTRPVSLTGSSTLYVLDAGPATIQGLLIDNNRIQPVFTRTDE